MVNKIVIHPLAQIILSVGASVFMGFSGHSLSKAKTYQVQLAEYKLQVGTVLTSVEKVSDTLEQTAKTSAIAPADKKKIQQLTQKSDRLLEAVEKDIEEQTEKLIKSESEE